MGAHTEDSHSFIASEDVLKSYLYFCYSFITTLRDFLLISFLPFVSVAFMLVCSQSSLLLYSVLSPGKHTWKRTNKPRSHRRFTTHLEWNLGSTPAGSATGRLLTPPPCLQPKGSLDSSWPPPTDLWCSWPASGDKGDRVTPLTLQPTVPLPDRVAHIRM